ncbi:aldo/keto reductase [Catellatospora sichuanensis]|uniref:aldo/keto reductase n=1 Tax=Catellatospora sichuanensis TaxID=1969805 RepID=UPI0011842831|nr:aldo/keto reductase [Catellatospora sichuanensis]
MSLERLDLSSPVARLGFGLAAVGRPGYINLGRDRDLPAGRTVEALRERTYDLLDTAYAAGMRYTDAARSYGRAEEFLAGWLGSRDVPDVVVGSKWGYTYTAGWRIDAEVHETKDHGLAVYERQLAQTRELLGDRLDAYQIHSLTVQSPALGDTALHRRLAELAATGVTVGFSSSGPRQADAIDAALRIEVDGVPLFRSVQATWNLLEPSAGRALAAARAAGCHVIVKEAMANGRLAQRSPESTVLAEVADETGAPQDAVALAAVLHQPWSGIVLSGAATTAQLTSNLAAVGLRLTDDQLSRLEALAESADDYWKHRSTLPWS